MSFLSRLLDKNAKHGKSNLSIKHTKNQSDGKTLKRHGIRPDQQREINVEGDKNRLAISEKLPIWNTGDIILNHYLVEDVITSGGMGRIYVATHQDWKVKIAIKSPTEEILSHPAFFSRVQKEAEAWIRLGLHPNIAYCYFVRNLDEVPFIFVEYVDGGNLRKWIEDHPLAELRFGLDLAIQFCHGMAHAHQNGMIHRDIKPQNILLTREGVLKITDFGIVKMGLDEKDSSFSQNDSGLEKTTGFIGTPLYASPEQFADAHDVGPESDVFSFGVCLWEMLLGVKPYAVAAERADPRTLRSNLPEELYVLLEEMVAFEKSERQNLGGFGQLGDKFRSIYAEVFDQPSPFSELENIDLKADGLNNRGVSLIELGMTDEAAECFKAAVEIVPDHLEAIYNHQLLSWRQALATDATAIKTLNAIDVSARNEIRKNILSAQLLIEAGHSQDAARLLEKALQKQPSANEPWLKLTEAFLYLSDRSSAMNVIFRASKLWPEDSGLKALREVIESSETIPGSFAGCSWREIDFKESLQNQAKSLAFHVETGRILLKDADANIYVSTLFESLPVMRIGKDQVGEIKEAAFGRDGKAIVLVGYDDLKIWSIEKRCLIKTLRWRKNSSFRMPMLCPDGTLFIVKMRSGMNEPASICCSRPQDSDLLQLCIEPDGNIVSADVNTETQRILSGSSRGACRLWSAESGFGECFHHNPRGIRFTCFDPFSEMRLTCSGGATTVWSGSGAKIREVNTFSEHGIGAAISPCGTYLATLNEIRSTGDKSGGCIHLYEMATGRCVSTINEVSCNFDSKIVFTKDSQMLITFSAQDKLRAWQTPRKFPMSGFELCRPQSLPELSAADQKAEKNILLAENYTLKKNYRKAYQALRLAQEDVNYRFDIRVNRVLQHLHEIGKKKRLLNHRCLFTMMEEYKAPVTALRFINERNLVSAADYGGLQHWDLTKGVCIGGLQGHRDAVRDITSTDSGRIIATVDEKNHMRVWDLASRQCTAFFDFSGHQDIFNHLTLNADGTLAFSAKGGVEGFLWNLEIGEIEYQIDLPLESKISQALFSGDGRSILVQYGNRSWFQIDSKSGHFEKLKVPLPGKFDCPVDISISSDRLSLNLRTGNGPDTVLRGHHHPILSHALSNNARMVASADAEGTIKLWELDWDLGF